MMHRIKRQQLTIAAGKTHPKNLGKSNMSARMGFCDKNGAASAYAIMKIQPHPIERSVRMDAPKMERGIPPAKKINAGRIKAVTKRTDVASSFMALGFVGETSRLT